MEGGGYFFPFSLSVHTVQVSSVLGTRRRRASVVAGKGSGVGHVLGLLGGEEEEGEEERGERCQTPAEYCMRQERERERRREREDGEIRRTPKMSICCALVKVKCLPVFNPWWDRMISPEDHFLWSEPDVKGEQCPPWTELQLPRLR